MNTTMKKSTLTLIAVCASTIVVFGQTMTNAQIGQTIKQLSGASVDYRVAGEWFKLARSTDNAKLKQELLKTAGAALLYAKKGDVYKKSVRSMINDVTDFEGSFEAECLDCGGVGESDGECKKCKGTGRCTYGSCRDGYVIIRGIDGSRQERCRECKGTGECPQCHGEGSVHGRCRVCGGSGKGWSRDAILQSYRDHSVAAWNMVRGIRIDEQKSVDPRNVDQTAWDKNQTYKFADSDKEILKKMLTQQRKSIAVNVDSSPLKNTGFDMAQFAGALQADIQGQLGKLPFLRPISANREMIEFINSEWGGSPKQDIPDYILLCRLTYANAQSGTVSVKAYFEIYDRAEGAARFSTTISKIGEKALSSGQEDTMQELFTTAAAEFMEQVVDQIGPVGVVAKTSGGGRYAYVSLGKEAGLIAGGRVQILEKIGGGDDFLSDLIEDSYVNEDGKKSVGVLDRRARLPLQSVADGHVVESTLPEPNRAWVEIDKFNPNSPRVKRGMVVRVVSMPRDRRQLAPTHTGSDLDREESELQRDRSEAAAQRAAREAKMQQNPMTPRPQSKPKPKYKKLQNNDDRSIFGDNDEDSDEDDNIFAR